MAALSISVVTFLSVLGYLVSLAIYRLYLSPLAKFPGPKLAALSKWYEAYYEIVQNGRFSFHIEDLHRQYGPIVRITPEEIHIRDPPSWETLYARHTKSSRYEWSAARFGNSSSTFTTSDPDLHKRRRAPLNNMFSRRAILGFEPVVQQKMQVLCDGLFAFHQSGGVCKISEAFSAFAGDVITRYCFSFDYDHLGAEGFTESFHDAFVAASAFGHIVLQFPWMQPLLNMMPEKWTKAMNPALAKVLDLQRDLRLKIAVVKEEFGRGDGEPETANIFHTLLKSDLPPAEKEDLRLAEEAQNLLGAGVETIAWSLSQATFYILTDARILAKLKKELHEAVPDLSRPGALGYNNLENLPYLRGCVKEAIRLALGVSGRNQRLLPKPLVWHEWIIPANTPISMNSQDVLLNDACFPHATSFMPERWLGETPTAPDGSPLEKYFVSFGKGPRSCLGVNLAYMEMFVVLGTIFRKFNLELYETDKTDVLLQHDFFIPCPKLDTKGIRVKVIDIDD